MLALLFVVAATIDECVVAVVKAEDNDAEDDLVLVTELVDKDARDG